MKTCIRTIQENYRKTKVNSTDYSITTVAQSCHRYFQTPPVTEFTTCETAISCLTQNSLPNDLQCCRRHNIHNQPSSMSHKTCLLIWKLLRREEKPAHIRNIHPNMARYTSYSKNQLVHRTLPKTRFIGLI